MSFDGSTAIAVANDWPTPQTLDQLGLPAASNDTTRALVAPWFELMGPEPQSTEPPTAVAIAVRPSPSTAMKAPKLVTADRVQRVSLTQGMLEPLQSSSSGVEQRSTGLGTTWPTHAP